MNRRNKISLAGISIFLIALLLSFTGSASAAEGEKDRESGNKKTSAEVYKSRHGFSIKYPETWRLETQVELYESLDEAEKEGGNYFAVMSYQEDEPRMKGFHYFPADTLKIEAWIFPDYGNSLAELITETKGIARIDDFEIGGKKAKKVWQVIEEGMLEGEEVYSIYFVDGGKKVIFTCYPNYTRLTDKFEEVVGSFRFE
ncbi:MAG: hypothetical protein RIG61_07310 [Deltaproteobacteria bacterium]